VIKKRFVSIPQFVSHALHSTSGVPRTAVALPFSTVEWSESSHRLRREVVRNYDFVWRSLRRLGVAQASVEDAAQQVLVVFAQRLDDIHPGAERAFLFSTATRVASDARKHQTRLRELNDSDALDAHPSPAPSAEQLIDRGRARDLLDVILAEMPLELRTVFILFELEEMTMAAIAETLSLPAGTVASRLRRARALFNEKASRFERGGRRP
jgi:RNA polymerase sigma-70 factor (ECF subfamily)